MKTGKNKNETFFVPESHVSATQPSPKWHNFFQAEYKLGQENTFGLLSLLRTILCRMVRTKLQALRHEKTQAFMKTAFISHTCCDFSRATTACWLDFSETPPVLRETTKITEN